MEFILESKLKPRQKLIFLLIITPVLLISVVFSIESEIYWLNLTSSGQNFDKKTTKLMFVADYLEKLGDKNIQLAIYDNILLTNPSNDIVQIKKFLILYNEKRYDEAAKHFEYAEKEVKNLNLLPLEYAAVLGALNRYDDALAIYENIIDENISANEWKSRKHVMQKLYPEPELEIKLMPLFESAKLFEMKQEFSKALESYEDVLIIDRYNFQALTGIIRVYTTLENFDKAEQIYEKMFHYYQLEIKTADSVKDTQRITSDHINALRAFARMYENQSEYGYAFNVYVEVLTLDRFNIMGLNGYADMAEKRGFPTIALQAYQTLHVLDPSNEEYKQKLDTLIDQV